MKCCHIVKSGPIAPRGEYAYLYCVAESDGQDGLCPVHRELERNGGPRAKPKARKPLKQDKLWSDNDATRSGR